MDGASNYLKSFRVFGDETIGGTNTNTLGEIRHEFVKDHRGEEFDELVNNFVEKAQQAGLSDVEIENEFLTLAEIWNDNEESLPKRIRCIVHLLVLIPILNFGITTTQYKDYWKNVPHAEFKSKYTIISNI